MFRRVALLVGICASQGCMGSMMFGWVPAASEEPDGEPEKELAVAPEPARCGPATLHLAATASAAARSDGKFSGQSRATQARRTTGGCESGGRR